MQLITQAGTRVQVMVCDQPRVQSILSQAKAGQDLLLEYQPRRLNPESDRWDPPGYYARLDGESDLSSVGPLAVLPAGQR